MPPGCCYPEKKINEKRLNNNPLNQTHTHKENERPRWMAGKLVAVVWLVVSVRRGKREMKDSLPIVHDPVRSKHIRQAARPPSSERMQCYLSLLLSNKFRLILREQDPVRFATLYYYPPYPPHNRP